MFSLSFLLPTAIILLAISTAGINTFVKDQAKGKKLVFALALLNGLVGVWSLIYTSQSGREQAALLKDINYQAAQQTSKANELVSSLKSAQDTTRQISSDLTSTSKTVKRVLTETQRGLQPLQTLGIYCYLELPQSNPEVASTLKNYQRSARSIPYNVSLNRPDLRSLLLTAPMARLGFEFLPNSDGYPKPETALGLLVRSFRVNMQFHLSHHSPGRYAERAKPLPSLAIDFMEDTSRTGIFSSRWLQTDTTGPLLYVMNSNVSRDRWQSDGSILSVTDLVGAQVVAQPVFAIPPTDQWKEYNLDRDVLAKAQTIWEGITLNALTLFTQDGRRWAFNIAKSKTVKQLNVPIFVGEFDRLLKPLEAK